MPFNLEKPVAIRCLIDWNNDGGFSNANSDVSSRVAQVAISAGYTDPTKHIAAVGTCEITLNNYDGKFSLLNSSSPLFGKMIQNLAVQVWVYTGYNYSAGAWTNYDAFEQFTGYIRIIRTKAGKTGELTTVITCDDAFGLLKDNENFFLPIVQNVNSNFLMAAIVNGGVNGASQQYALKFTSNPTNGDTISFSPIPYYGFGPIFSTDTGASVGTTFSSGASPITLAGGYTSLQVGQYIMIDTEIFLILSISGASFTVSNQQLGSAGGTHNAGTRIFAFFNIITFTFVTALSGKANEILIAGTLQATLYNFLAALNQVRYWFDNTGTSHDTGGAGVGFASNINPIGTHIANPYLQNTDGTISGTYLDTNGYPILVSFFRDGTSISTDLFLTLSVYGTYFSNHAIVFPYTTVNTLTQGVGAGTLGFLSQHIIPGTVRNIYQVAGDTTKTKTPTEVKNNAMSELEKLSIAEFGKMYYTPSLVALGNQIGGEDGKGFGFKTLLDLYKYYNLPNSSFIDLGTAPLFDAIVDRDKIGTHSLITYYPRTTSSPGIVLGQIFNAEAVPGKSGGERWAGVIKLPQGGVKTIRIDYKEPISNNAIGGMNLITPLVPYTDYTANDKADGKGFDYTGNANLSFSIVNNGTNAEITVRNTALGTLYLTKLQIRGTAIYNYHQSTQSAQSALILSGFNNTITENIDYAVDGNNVLAYAQWMIMQYGQPTARLTEDVDFKNKVYTINGAGTAIPLFQYANMFQPVLISDPQSGIVNGRFVIIGYKKTIKSGGAVDVKLRLMVIEPFAVFTLDDATYGVLDTVATDVLGA